MILFTLLPHYLSTKLSLYSPDCHCSKQSTKYPKPGATAYFDWKKLLANMKVYRVWKYTACDNFQIPVCCE